MISENDFFYIKNNFLISIPIVDFDFLSDWPSLMHGISIRYVQHSQAMSERGVCELAHSFFHIYLNYFLSLMMRKIRA